MDSAAERSTASTFTITWGDTTSVDDNARIEITGAPPLLTQLGLLPHPSDAIRRGSDE